MSRFQKESNALRRELERLQDDPAAMAAALDADERARGRVPYTNGPVAVVREKDGFHVRLQSTSGTHGKDVVVATTIKKAIQCADRVAKYPDRYRKAFKL